MRVKTINRGWLKRQVLQGKVEAMRKFRYTDDYAYDAQTNYGKTEWIPARISTNWEDRKDGYMNFDEYDFRAKGSSAWLEENGNITLYEGFQSFELRIVNIK